MDTEQTEEDPDVLLTNTVKDKSSQSENIFLVGEYVDLLIISSLSAEENENIYFFKSSIENVICKL